MKRLFIAIKINPEETLVNLYNLLNINTTHDKIKWVNINNIHITLKFLGETEENKTHEIITCINNVVKNISHLHFDISQIGIFGSNYQPKVIWLGIKNEENLINLATQIHNELENIGFNKDRQNFVPHLTLGRINYITDKKRFTSIIKKLNIQQIQSVEVNEIILYESILKKEGPVYTVIEKFKLK